MESNLWDWSSLGALFTPRNLFSLFTIWLVYKLAIILYNISPLHPLYKFPGSKLAAATFLYEGYYDLFLVGRYSHKIREMHRQYGPIIRINPGELHCNDPQFADEIYATGNRKRDKWQHFLDAVGGGPVAVSTFATISHEHHRARRAPMNKYFSRGQMLKLEGEVLAFARRTCDKLLATEGPFDLKEAFNCFTADIISQYCFGAPMGFVDQAGWEPNFGGWIKDFFNATYVLRFVPPARLLVALPPSLTSYLGVGMKNLMHQLHVVIPDHIREALRDRENKRVFADILESKQLPDAEKTITRLSAEGFILLTAGTETTAAALSCISYYLLAQPETYTRLKEDLQGIDPNNVKWTDLEQRPYLWAVIHESLRILPGMSHRSARIARDEDLVYASKTEEGITQWTIPRGTPMSMTAIIQHYNEDLFPSPKDFVPERWLVDGRQDYALEKNLMAFSKGSRYCLGRELAYCELYILTACLALRVLPRARLYDTTKEDVEYDHDMVVPQSKKGFVRVKVVIS